MKPFSLLLLFIVLFVIHTKAQDAPDSIVTQRIVYHSKEAGEVYLKWSVDFWQKPDSSQLPPHSKFEGKLAVSLMKGNRDSFFTDLKLPRGTRLDFYFYVYKNASGRTIKGTDNNLQSNYFIQADGSGAAHFQSAPLSRIETRFSLLKASKYLLAGAVCLLALVLLLYRRRLRIRYTYLLPALWLSALAVVMLARAEIAHTRLRDPLRFLGAIKQDVLVFLVCGLALALLVYLVHKKPRLLQIAVILSSGFLLLVALIAVLNIEVVKQLGTPFNYKWLYYSDFLKEADTMKGAAQTLNKQYLFRVACIMGALLLFGWSLYYPLNAIVRLRVGRLLLGSALAVLVLVCVVADRYRYNSPTRKEASLWAIVRSLYEPSGKEQLLNAQVSPAISQYFHAAAQAGAQNEGEAMAGIDHIVVFVSESTPASLVSLYNRKYACTPRLEQWSKAGRVFTNMYTQIPSTPNAMISLLAGVYPMLDYRSALMEKVQWPSPGLPQVLGSAGWHTGLFFSSDLEYGGMGPFARRQGFKEIQDFSNLPCKDVVQLNRSDLNGMDDSCMAAQYLKWLEAKKGQHTFAVLWTSQTHSPYFAEDKVNYTGRKDKLNRYLNALNHSDAVFGGLMDDLQRKGVLDRTLVLFIADHGEAFGTHDQQSHASRIYEENVRIPCVLINPRLFKGEKDSTIRSMIDIGPTVAQVAGLTKPAGWQGHNMLAGKKDGRAFFVSPYTDLLLGTRNKNWKYIYNVNTREAELYNLDNDPEEKINIAQQFPEVAKQEQDALTGWYQYACRFYTNKANAMATAQSKPAKPGF